MQWSEINALKPNPNINDPEDDLKIEDAERTIGDFKLKIDPLYDAPDDIRDTTLKKFKELLTARKDIYDIRQEYNSKVFDLRKEKVEVLNFVESKKDKLNEIHKELDKDKQKHANIVVEIDQDMEYPERNFNIQMHLNVEERDKDLLYVPMTEQQDHNSISNIQREILGITSKQDPLTLTTCEADLIQHRLQLQLYEQDKIIHQIEQRVKAFDSKLQALYEERLQVDFDAKFLEQYLITLNQELWVLKDFEQLEEKLIDRMEQLIFEQNQIHMQLIKEKNDIETYKGNIAEVEEQQNDVEARFIERCRSNPYWKYFRKIFYKKYRPPRIPKERDFDEDAEYGNILYLCIKNFFT